jgi:predicted RNA-binding Zn ribbon-like protein
MLETGIDGGALHLDEARLCIDFTNTVDWHASAHPQEELTSYAALVTWAREKGVVPPQLAERLLARAGAQPEQAAVVLQQARDLRDAIYRIFTAVAHDTKAQPADLAIVNNALSTTLPLLRVVAADDRFGWHWAGRDDALDSVLWPVTQSAAQLLTSEDIHHLGQCADDRGCGWLFLDTSKNHSRRWCSMDGCGNRAKALRHYERARRGDAERGR